MMAILPNLKFYLVKCLDILRDVYMNSSSYDLSEDSLLTARQEADPPQAGRKGNRCYNVYDNFEA